MTEDTDSGSLSVRICISFSGMIQYPQKRVSEIEVLERRYVFYHRPHHSY
jgi:hypothetical protein